jgi:hypothetical protein
MNVVSHIKTYQRSPGVIERAYCRNLLDSVMTRSMRFPFPARIEACSYGIVESGQNRSLPLPQRKNPKPWGRLEALSELVTGARRGGGVGR